MARIVIPANAGIQNCITPLRVGTGTGVTPLRVGTEKCVTPAKAEVQEVAWIPASAGMTRR